MSVDTSIFKVSFLVGDIVTGKLEGKPLPPLTSQEHEQLRAQLEQESIWLQENGERAGSRKDRIFTDRIAESFAMEENEREGICWDTGLDITDGLTTEELNDMDVAMEGKRSLLTRKEMVRDVEKKLNSLANAKLKEFQVNLSLAMKDIEAKQAEKMAKTQKKKMDDSDTAYSTATVEYLPHVSVSMANKLKPQTTHPPRRGMAKRKFERRQPEGNLRFIFQNLLNLVCIYFLVVWMKKALVALGESEFIYSTGFWGEQGI